MSTTHQPKYLATAITTGAVIMLFVLLTLLAPLPSLLQSAFYGILGLAAVMFIELTVFSRAADTNADGFIVTTGLKHLLGHAGDRVPYTDIVKIEEKLTPKKKFSTLHIHTKTKVFSVPITGLSDYDGFRAALFSHVPESVVSR